MDERGKGNRGIWRSIGADNIRLARYVAIILNIPRESKVFGMYVLINIG